MDQKNGSSEQGNGIRNEKTEKLEAISGSIHLKQWNEKREEEHEFDHAENKVCAPEIGIGFLLAFLQEPHFGQDITEIEGVRKDNITPKKWKFVSNVKNDVHDEGDGKRSK